MRNEVAKGKSDRKDVGPKNAASWNVFTAATMRNVFWDIIPCGCSKNQYVGEHIASIFMVIEF
jgi:hypothetical protein